VASDIRARPNHEPVEPAVEAVHVAQRGQIAPGSEKGFLGRILGEVGVAQDESSDGVQPIDGAARQHGEGLSVPTACPGDELRLHASPSQERPTVASYSTAERGPYGFILRSMPENVVATRERMAVAVRHTIRARQIGCAER
jgi:hypothetical protein